MIQDGLSRRFGPTQATDGGITRLQQGRIIAVNPAQRTADVVLKQGGILRGVRVLGTSGGTHEGENWLPAVTVPVDTTTVPQYAPTGDHDTYCVIGYLDGDLRKPRILGLDLPDRTEVSFSDKEVNKHGNGSYTVWDADGYEFDRPDGTYFRVGASTTKLALAGKNFDSATQPFSETAGTSSTVPYVYLKHSSGSSVSLAPNGDVLVTHVSGNSITLNSTGFVVGGPLTITSLSATTITATAITATSLTASAYVAIGTNPAQSGLLRLANGASAIVFRNFANGADIAGLHLDTNNKIVIAGQTPGADGSFLTADAATTGGIKYSTPILDATTTTHGYITGDNQKRMTVQALGNITGATSIDLSLGDYIRATLVGNVSLTLTNPSSDHDYHFELIQDGTGSRTVTWTTTVKWQGGNTPVATTTASKKDQFLLHRDTADYLGNATLNF